MLLIVEIRLPRVQTRYPAFVFLEVSSARPLLRGIFSCGWQVHFACRTPCDCTDTLHVRNISGGSGLPHAETLNFPTQNLQTLSDSVGSGNGMQ